ncbi:MAG: MBL fold metallo-hydrolase [Clostridiales bacterium]|nr:MBL fold metallo-hydrolase [Clostridiales bacterium]
MTERIKISYANCYLLSGDKGSILVDTCNYKDGPAIYSRIKDRNVRLILLTHGHFDHVSSAKYLAKRLNVPIAMSEADVHLIGNGQASKLHANTPLGRIMVFFSQGVLKKAEYSLFTPDVLLEDGQDLSEYGVNARVISLPGHTKGSVGVLTADGDFIVGDAMFNMLRPTGSRLFEDRIIMEESLQKIRSSGAKTIYVGHGKPIGNN